MTRKKTIKVLVMLSFFIFITTFDISIKRSFGQNCENTPEMNQSFVDYIYTKLNADKNLAPQVSHINVTSTNLVIKLYGWADNASDWNKIHQIALENKCANLVNPYGLLKSEPDADSLMRTCSNGTKQCGDICIPDNDVCNIKGGEF